MARSHFTRWVLSGIALLTPALGIYAPLGLAPLLGIAALAVLAARFRGQGEIAIPPILAALMVCLCIFAALSLLWTYDRGISAAKYHRLVLSLASGTVVIGAAIALDTEARAAVGRWLIAGLIAAMAVLALERATGGMLLPVKAAPASWLQYINQFNRGVNICAIVVWPAIYFAARRRPLYGTALGVVLFALLFAFNSTAAVGAMVVGTIAFGLVWLAPRISGLALSAGIVFAIIATPFAIHSLPPPKEVLESTPIPRSSYHRLLVWDFTSARIMERPVLGWGFDSSRIIPGGKRSLDEWETALPLHPHNGALQLWLELGVGGAMLGAAIALMAAEAIRRHGGDRLSRAAASATFGAAMLVFQVSYGSWQSWWMATLFIAAALAIVVRSPAPRRNAA